MSAYRSAEPCPRCKSGTTTREGECLSCGALWGSAFLCPHCGEHAKTEADRLLGSTCAKCAVPRIARPLPKEAYARLRHLLRVYRLLPARAAIYVPVLALSFALMASVISPRMIADAKNERASYIAERGTSVGAPTSTVAELLPEAPLAFLAGLGTVGALGIVVFLSIAGAFRFRIRREAARVAGLESPPPSRSL